MSAELIAGVTYRCKVCRANLGDPEEGPSFSSWEKKVRAHYHLFHGAGIYSASLLNNLVEAMYIWTTPAGKEVVTTGEQFRRGRCES